MLHPLRSRKKTVYLKKKKKNPQESAFFSIFNLNLKCKKTFQPPRQDHSASSPHACNLRVIFNCAFKLGIQIHPQASFFCQLKKALSGFLLWKFSFFTDVPHRQTQTPAHPRLHRLQATRRIKLETCSGTALSKGDAAQPSTQLPHLSLHNDPPIPPPLPTCPPAPPTPTPATCARSSAPLMPTFCLYHPGPGTGRGVFTVPTSIWNVLPQPKMATKTPLVVTGA